MHAFIHHRQGTLTGENPFANLVQRPNAEAQQSVLSESKAFIDVIAEIDTNSFFCEYFKQKAEGEQRENIGVPSDELTANTVTTNEQGTLVAYNTKNSPSVPCSPEQVFPVPPCEALSSDTPADFIDGLIHLTLLHSTLPVWLRAYVYEARVPPPRLTEKLFFLAVGTLVFTTYLAHPHGADFSNADQRFIEAARWRVNPPLIGPEQTPPSTIDDRVWTGSQTARSAFGRQVTPYRGCYSMTHGMGLPVRTLVNCMKRPPQGENVALLNFIGLLKRLQMG